MATKTFHDPGAATLIEAANRAMAGNHSDHGPQSGASSSTPKVEPPQSSDGGGKPPKETTPHGGGSGGGSGLPKTPLLMRYIGAITGVVLALGAVWWYTHDTPPNRAAGEIAFMQKGIEEEKTKQKREETKQARELTKREALKAQQNITVATCASPVAGTTLFWQPLSLSAGDCVQLSPPQNGGMYFWAVFNSMPISMSGISEIKAARDTGNIHPNGSRDIEPMESCAAESCTKFLSEHLGMSLFIRQARNQSLHINL